MTKKIELNDQMKDEVAEVLEQHMPKFVCGVVKERLEEADAMEQELEDVKKELEALRLLKLDAEELDEIEAKLNKLEKEQDKARQEHKDAVADFERNKKVFELETKLEAQKVVTAHAQNVNSNLTRNLDYRRTLYKNEDIVNVGYTDQYGCHFGPTNTGCRANTDETITESVD